MTYTYGRFIIAGFLSALLVFSAENLFAQVQEPEVRPTPRNITSLQDAYSSGFGINIDMNNFGFGLGGEFRRVIAPQAEGYLKFGVTGLRDASEQTFTDIFFGQQIVPNKYNRAFAFPLMLGMRQRIFPDIIQENYRFFISAAAGGVAAFTYPYFDDPDGLGYRFIGNELIQINEDQFAQFQPTPINDIFQGWSDGSWHFGGAGEVKLGVDIGSNMARLNSVEFGYYFYYFPNGIQLMSPRQPSVLGTLQGRFVVLETDQDNNVIFEDFFSAQKFFGTPMIRFTFGWFW